MSQRTWRRWSKCFLFYQYGIFSCLLFSFFSIKYFFYGYWQLTGQQGKGGNCLLFHPVTSNRSKSFRHLFVILHVRFLSRSFNRNACICWWDLPPYRIIIWFIDDVMLIFVCFLVDLILRFVAAVLHEKSVGSNSHQLSSCITCKRTNQGC